MAASGAVLALVAAVAVGLSVRVDCLIVRTRGGDVRAVLPLSAPGAPDRSFSLSFRHSVAKLPVEDFFRPRDGAIQLYRTVYRGLGAGLPFTDEGGTMSIVDGAIVIAGLDRRVERLSVSPSSFTEDRLTVRGVRYDFYALAGGGTVTLEIAKRPFLIATARRMPTKGEPR